MGEVSKGEIKLDEIRELEEDKKRLEESGLSEEAESQIFADYPDEGELSEEDIERILSSGLRSEYLEELRRRKKEIARLKQIQIELNKKMAEYLYLKMTYDKLEEKSKTIKDVWKDTPENRNKFAKLFSNDYINKKVAAMLDGIDEPFAEAGKAASEVHKKSQREAGRNSSKSITR